MNILAHQLVVNDKDLAKFDLNLVARTQFGSNCWSVGKTDEQIVNELSTITKENGATAIVAGSCERVPVKETGDIPVYHFRSIEDEDGIPDRELYLVGYLGIKETKFVPPDWWGITSVDRND